MLNSVKAGVFLLGLLIAGTASAEGYFGVGAGKAEADVDGIDLGDDTGIKVFGGSKINPNFGFEISYIDFGETTLTGNGSVTLEASGFDFALMGILPAGQSVELFGKVGILMWDADATYVSVPGIGSGTVSDDGTDINFGVGINFNMSDKFTFRGSYEMFEMDDIEIDYLSAAVLYRF